MKKIYVIQTCHMMVGGFDYPLKVRYPDMDEYRSISTDCINDLPGVYQTSSFPAMEGGKRNPNMNLANSFILEA
jgi:Lrp/AsnC family leucine-responsive transcriptional regulator